jgi:4a-hydroxytetrahydrobiopterin dehydratase
MNWKVKNGKLVKEFEFADFDKALAFVNQVAELAEEASHHPDILIYSYNKVKIMIYTHDKNEITDKDHALAKKINSLN